MIVETEEILLPNPIAVGTAAMLGSVKKKKVTYMLEVLRDGGCD